MVTISREACRKGKRFIVSRAAGRFALALLFLTALAAKPFEPPFRYPEGRLGEKAELKYRNGLPVLVASGTPEELGTAVGALAVKNAPRALGYPRELIEAFGAQATWKILVQAGRGMVKHFPPDYLTELDALTRAARADRDAVVAGNTLFDLKKMFNCSALLIDAERSATGGPLLARNLDHLSLGYIHQYSLVTVYRPAGKHAFAAVGFPGLVGCLSGLNDAGLALAILEVFDVKDGEPHFDIEGTPYALCYRKVLEECTTIDEARKLLESLHRTTTTNLALADKKGVAVFEVTPRRVERRGAERGVMACTNHYCAASLRPAEPLDPNGSFERLALLEEARKSVEKMTPDDLRLRLHQASLGPMTLQTMVFDPVNLRLYLGIGETPATRVPLKALDLAPLFKGK